MTTNLLLTISSLVLHFFVKVPLSRFHDPQGSQPTGYESLIYLSNKLYKIFGCVLKSEMLIIKIVQFGPKDFGVHTVLHSKYVCPKILVPILHASAVN